MPSFKGYPVAIMASFFLPFLKPDYALKRRSKGSGCPKALEGRPIATHECAPKQDFRFKRGKLMTLLNHSAFHLQGLM